MSLDKRRQVAERIIALLREEGYIRTGGEINRETRRVSDQPRR